jgi:ribonuclease HII
MYLYNMKTQENIHNLKVGYNIEFINKVGYNVKRQVTRISEKSCYLDGTRNSWNTVNSYFNEFDVKINK